MEHGSSRGLVSERGVPTSGVLGKEWLSLPGAEGEPAPPEGRQEVGGDWRRKGRRARPLRHGSPPPVRPGRRKGKAGAGALSRMQAGSWGRGWCASGA